MERAEPGIYTLCYHHVTAEAQASFSAQIDFLKRFGTFIDADTALEFVRSGRALRERAFVLSFDDGYADSIEVALPVIMRQRVPAILFLVSAWIDDPPVDGQGYMTRGDIGRWLAAGLDVGSHGLSHRRLSHLSPGDAEVELLGSARALSALIKRPVRHFACPWGVADADFLPARDPALAREAGYQTFFTTRRGKARDSRDLAAMPRHVLEPEWALYQLETLLGGWKFARS